MGAYMPQSGFAPAGVLLTFDVDVTRLCLS